MIQTISLLAKHSTNGLKNPPKRNDNAILSFCAHGVHILRLYKLYKLKSSLVGRGIGAKLNHMLDGIFE